MKLGLKNFNEDLEFEFGQTTDIEEALVAALDAMASFGSDNRQVQVIGVLLSDIKQSKSKALDFRISEDKKKNGD